MTGARGAAAAAALACAVTAGLAACAVDPPPPPTTVAPTPTPDPSAPQLSATGEVAFPRTLQADRMVEVRVETPGGARGLIASVAVESPYFAPSGTIPTNVLLEPGWTSRLRVPLGTAICPAGEGETSATLEVRAYDGTALAERQVTLDDEVLAEINAAECRQRIATDAAAPAFSDQRKVVDGVLETSVELTRGASTEPATLTALSGNVIFALVPVGEALPVTLEAGDLVASVPVDITATRCDAHAFAESKKTFVFTATYEVAGERITVEYRAEGDTREALQDLFDACGAQSDADGIGGQ